MNRKGNRFTVIPSKYNLYAICDEFNMNMEDLAKQAGVNKYTCYKYMWTGKTGKASADAIEEVILQLTDNPEDYLWEKWEGYKPSKGRKKGSKNKNGPCKHIELTEEEVDKYLNKEKPQVKAAPISKIIIQDLDSFIDILKQGNQIYQENSPNYFKLIEGLVVKFNNKGEPLFINPAIDIKEKYYYLKRESLNIEVSKTYITENNKEVNIFAFKYEDDTYLGVITGYSNFFRFDQEGHVLDNKGIEFNIQGEKI